jgi:hypothetical protein
MIRMFMTLIYVFVYFSFIFLTKKDRHFEPWPLTFRPSDFQTFRPSDFQTFRPSDIQTFRLSDFQTFDYSKNRLSTPSVVITTGFMVPSA